jgi:hypothetical protein
MNFADASPASCLIQFQIPHSQECKSEKKAQKLIYTLAEK